MTRDQLRTQLGVVFSSPRKGGPRSLLAVEWLCRVRVWSFPSGDFFELDFAGASRKREPRLHCVLTGLVMHTHPVSTLLVLLLKEAQPEATRGGQGIISSSPQTFQVQGHRFNTGCLVRLKFQISNKSFMHKYIPCSLGDIPMLKKIFKCKLGILYVY